MFEHRISVVDNAPFLAVVKYACEEFKVKFETSAVISPGSAAGSAALCIATILVHSFCPPLMVHLVLSPVSLAESTRGRWHCHQGPERRQHLYEARLGAPNHSARSRRRHVSRLSRFYKCNTVYLLILFLSDVRHYKCGQTRVSRVTIRSRATLHSHGCG